MVKLTCDENQTTKLEHPMKTNIWRNIGMAAATAFLATGCAGMGGSELHRTTNLTAFFNSTPTGSVENKAPAVLSKPLHVGIAFVPADGVTNRTFAYANAGPNYASAGANGPNYSFPAAQPVAESVKLDLMKQFVGCFSQYPAVQSADLISADYLTPRGGFDNLDRIRATYGVDVVILLSYDQAQFTDEGAMTLTYWTIVGAYMVPAEKIDTKTVLEAAAYDIGSRKLLFRATGEADLKGSSTPVNLSEQLRLESKKSFELAVNHLAAKLEIKIAEFEKTAVATPQAYFIQQKPDKANAGLFGEKE
jgi:rhombotail lipoprotein